MGDDDDRHINLSGEWIARQSDGGQTATLYHEGHRITGHGTGGLGHPTLTNRFKLEGGGRRYVGTITAVEGAVTGGGKLEIEILDPHTIKMSWDGHWSGGGSSGHAEGHALMNREHH